MPAGKFLQGPQGARNTQTGNAWDGTLPPARVPHLTHACRCGDGAVCVVNPYDALGPIHPQTCSRDKSIDPGCCTSTPRNVKDVATLRCLRNDQTDVPEGDTPPRPTRRKAEFQIGLQPNQKHGHRLPTALHAGTKPGNPVHKQAEAEAGAVWVRSALLLPLGLLWLDAKTESTRTLGGIYCSPPEPMIRCGAHPQSPRPECVHTDGPVALHGCDHQFHGP